MTPELKTQELYPAEREYEILERLKQHGRISVSELSQVFGISEATVRADLQSLATRNLIVRTHGGAILASRGLADLSLATRQQQQIVEKTRIGQAAAAMVSDGEAIFLDISSTALAIAQHLTSHHRVTVITNSLAIVQELFDAPRVTVVMPGGTLDRETASLGGTNGLETLRKFNIQKGFFGVHGISPTEGLTAVSIEWGESKRMMVGMCRQVIAVLDGTKWGRVGLVSFAGLKDVDCIITDDQAPANLVEEVRALGIEVTLV
jgi:DeoR/GlpR family transcriptional regulator of sugar metabolism